ncbi:MAG: YihY/virulence factor BrkB family protein [Lachnospiraceae bacterium]|nr:YihY/virulence factor BrkB family protein [Lachnospiraceae bacterium]
MGRLTGMLQFSRNVLRKVNQDQVRAHSAEAAFFIMMSFFPILMLLISLIKYTSITPEEIVNAIEDLTPFTVRESIEPILDSIYGQTIALVSGTAAVAIWTAGKAVLGLADGLNTIYRIEETRNYFVVWLRAAVYIFALVVSLGISLILLVMGYGARDYLPQLIPFFRYLTIFGTVLPALFTMAVLVILFLFMYSYLPNRRMKMSTQLPGAIFASIAWCVFSYCFSIYLEFSVNMSVIYGSLTTLVVVMLWLYVCMYLLFIGAEINHYLAAPELFSPDVPAPWDSV